MGRGRGVKIAHVTDSVGQHQDMKVGHISGHKSVARTQLLQRWRGDSAEVLKYQHGIYSSLHGCFHIETNIGRKIADVQT